jgi:hypothetical protein
MRTHLRRQNDRGNGQQRNGEHDQRIVAVGMRKFDADDSADTERRRSESDDQWVITDEEMQSPKALAAKPCLEGQVDARGAQIILAIAAFTITHRTSSFFI